AEVALGVLPPGERRGQATEIEGGTAEAQRSEPRHHDPPRIRPHQVVEPGCAGSIPDEGGGLGEEDDGTEPVHVARDVLEVVRRETVELESNIGLAPELRIEPG